MNSICVYCGANFNGDPQLAEQVRKLAHEMVSQGIRLVYGGGRVGLMGLIADAVLEKGGEVVGVIPQFLMDKEVGHTGLTELIITENMHQRKQMMADLSNGFIILPGGFGTMEEFFEILTWLQLGLHNKGIGVLNYNGFYNPLLTLMDNMVDSGFLKEANKHLVIAKSEPLALIEALKSFKVDVEDKWFEERNLI